MDCVFGVGLYRLDLLQAIYRKFDCGSTRCLKASVAVLIQLSLNLIDEKSHIPGSITLWSSWET
ncbi:MAG: hypothetical protein ACREHD_07145 [Pirellulales bacterium]